MDGVVGPNLHIAVTLLVLDQLSPREDDGRGSKDLRDSTDCL